MTRARIIELLDKLVLEMANHLPAPDYLLPEDVVGAQVAQAEWAYVKGLAAGQILRLRERLRELP